MKKILIITLISVSLIACAKREKNIKKENNKITQSKSRLPEIFDYNDDEDEEEAPSSSLWAKNENSLFADKKAMEVGDIVAIIINESASARQSNSLARDKSGKVNAKGGTGLLNLIPEMTAEGETGISNSGSSQRSGNLTARVSAKVIKKDRYGNLYIKGTRNVLISNELQEIEISGFVRPEDIGTDNSVQSSYLAEAEVKYSGKLVFDGKAKPGLVSNFLGSVVGFFF